MNSSNKMIRYSELWWIKLQICLSANQIGFPVNSQHFLLWILVPLPDQIKSFAIQSVWWNHSVLYGTRVAALFKDIKDIYI